MEAIPKSIAALAQSIPEYICSPNSFIKVELIEKRNSYEYWHAKDSKTDNDIFVKEFTAEPFIKKYEIQFAREASILQKCNHRLVAQLIGFTTEPPFSILYDYYPGKSLSNSMFSSEKNKKNKKSIAFSGTHLTTIALSLSHVMMYMHETLNVIHGNLVTDSIQLNSKQIGILTHFEDAFYDDKDRPKILRTVMFPSMAPEMVNSTNYTKKVDVYAYGFVLYEMCEGSHPYADKSDEEMLALFSEGNQKLKFSSSVPKPLKNLIQSCCSFNPDERPSSREIFEEFASGRVSFAKTDTKRMIRIATKLTQNFNAHQEIKKKLSISEMVLPKITKDHSLFDIIPQFDTAQKIEIDKKLISNSSQPKFLDNLKLFGDKCNDNTAKEFYEATSQFLTPDNSKSIRVAAFKIYYETMQHARKLIDVCYDSQLYFNLPSNDNDLIECSLDLLASLFILRPSVVTTEITETLTTFINLKPLEICLIFGQLSRVAPPYKIYYPVIKLFFDCYEVYSKANDTCLVYVRFWNNILCTNAVLRNTFKPKLNKFLSSMLKIDSSSALVEIYNFIAKIIDYFPDFEVDYDLIIKHLSLEDQIESIFSVLMRQKQLPVNRDLCNLLVKWAYDIEDAQCVLFKFAEQNEESALMVASNRSWLVDGLATDFGIYALIFILFKFNKCIPIVYQYEELPSIFMRLICMEDNFVLATIGNIIDICINDSQTFNRFDKAGVFVSYFQIAAKSNEGIVHIKASELIQSMAQFNYKFTSAYALFIPTLSNMLALQNSSTIVAISTIVSLSSFKEMIPTLLQYNIHEYFKTLLPLNEYKDLALIFFKNIGNM